MDDGKEGGCPRETGDSLLKRVKVDNWSRVLEQEYEVLRRAAVLLGKGVDPKLLVTSSAIAASGKL